MACALESFLQFILDIMAHIEIFCLDFAVMYGPAVELGDRKFGRVEIY